jgi:hypothetical protein
MTKKKVALLILDGWGQGEENISNPFRFAKTPNLDYFQKKFSLLSFKCFWLCCWFTCRRTWQLSNWSFNFRYRNNLLSTFGKN